ncbi:MAG: SMP-30/gluconolactonase/LRE family protein, partial [Pseudonocardiales bacterium]|nr:SMP-30/gluconolactonase/LRE family protein [Pseudonocardiales bacterium]
WFTNQFTSYLSRFTPRIHVLTTIPIPATAGAIADGPDGNLWFTAGSSVYRMRPTAPYTLTSYPVTQGSGVGQLTTGPDGNLWVLIENDGHGGSYIARLTPATGKFTYFDYHPDTAQSYSGIASITAGPDHSLWIAGGGVNTIITLKTTGSDTAIQNSLHDFDLPTPHSIPAGITQDAHGNIWFTEKGITRAVATITPSGHITEFPLPAANCPQSDFFGLPGRACQPSGITLGPDGKLWIAENGADAMVRMDTQINIVTGDVKNVNVKAGETTLIDEANVSGDITATGSSGVFVCSSIVHGNVNIDSSTGVGFIGSVPDNWVNCQGGQITGSVSVTNNQAGFAVGQYTIGGNVTVSNNYDGRVTSAASSADPMLRIEGNIIGGNLNCTNNAPEPPANEGIANTAHGSKNGQCSGL